MFNIFGKNKEEDRKLPMDEFLREFDKSKLLFNVSGNKIYLISKETEKDKNNIPYTSLRFYFIRNTLFSNRGYKSLPNEEYVKISEKEIQEIKNAINEHPAAIDETELIKLIRNGKIKLTRDFFEDIFDSLCLLIHFFDFYTSDGLFIKAGVKFPQFRGMPKGRIYKISLKDI